MNKIIFGVLPNTISVKSIAHAIPFQVITNTNLYSKLESIFSENIYSMQKSITSVFELVGLPIQTARLYTNKIKEKSGEVIAIIVPLEMEEKARNIFKQFNAESMTTINSK